MDDSKIVKNIIHTGTKAVTFVPGTKVVFHYRTTKCNNEKTLIDDSKTMGNAMELVLGKKFKLEVWEVIVQKMALNEVASFRVHRSLVTAYPFVSKTLREVGKPGKRSHHCCGVTLQNEGIGYDDLNDLIKNPQDLEFTIELISVLPPSDYEKESWQLTESEKLKSIPSLKEKGNCFFKGKNYEAAADTYAKAISYLEQLMLAEKPNDTEWNELNAMKLPLLLNFAQCKLFQKEYYAVIAHCTTVLKYDETNVKAFYRRGKAHIAVWNEREAFEDLNSALALDPSLRSAVEKELQLFSDAIKNKEKLEKEKLSQLFCK